MAVTLIEQLASNVRTHLGDVLANSQMPADVVERYFRVADTRLRDFGA